MEPRAGTPAQRKQSPVGTRDESTVVVIPVAEEELEIGKREVEAGRLRLQKRVSEHEQTVDEPLFADEITLERVTINRFIEEPTPARIEGDTTVIPLFEERLVVQKRLVLREEVRITRRRIERHAPQTVALRREEVTVERCPATTRSIDPEERRTWQSQS